MSDEATTRSEAVLKLKDGHNKPQLIELAESLEIKLDASHNKASISELIYDALAAKQKGKADTAATANTVEQAAVTAAKPETKKKARARALPELVQPPTLADLKASEVPGHEILKESTDSETGVHTVVTAAGQKWRYASE